MFDIICLGRLDFLVAVLNGLAMLTSSSGPAGYGGMVALGLLIGVILALMRGIVTQRLEIQWVLLGWILFSVLFVPKVTVTVEDIYTGATTTVANVPLGPAAIGSITSTVGVTLADAFGTVFAYPSLTNSGYMDSLELINAMRDMDYGGANDGDATHIVPGVDLQRTLRNYMMDCVFYDMAMGLPSSLDWQKVRESPDVLSAIRVNSNTWFTTQYLQANNLSGQTVTCADGYTQLAAFINGPFTSAWNQHIGSVLKLSDTTTQVQRALDTFFGLGKDAQVYMMNALFKRELELAELGYHVQGHDDAGVIMRVQAMEQRRTQWATEQSMWAEMARPIIAFIEGFFYAVSPFAAFMFTLGAPGITLFGRYLLLAVWIQLWMPVLAVSNLYITIAAANGLQQLGTGGTDPMSIAGLDSVWTQTASWLAIGGSMVAATPLLSLILITGSYFALTRLTDRLSGADHVDEKIQNPDILQPAAFASVGVMGTQAARYTLDPPRGMHITGMPEHLPSINLGSDLRANVQSAENAQVQARREWSAVFSSGLDLSRQENREKFNQSLLSTGTSSTHSEADGVFQQIARSAVKASGLSQEFYEQNRESVDAAVGLALQKGGNGGNTRSALSEIHGINETKKQEIADKIDRLVNVKSDFVANLAEKVEQDEREGISSRYLSAMGVTDAGKWAEAYHDSFAASSAYERAATLGQSVGLQQRIEPVVVGNQAQREGWNSELLQLASKHGLYTTELQDQIPGLADRAGVTEAVALNALAASALAEGPHEARMGLAELLGKHGFAPPHPQLDDPKRNEGLQSHVPIEGSARDAVEGNLTRVNGSLDSIRQGIQGQIGSAQELEDQGHLAVQDFFSAKKAENAEKAEEALKELEGVITIQRAQHYENTFEDTRSLLKVMNNFDWSGQLGDTSANTHGIFEAARQYGMARADIYEATGNPLSAVLGGLVAAFPGYAKGFRDEVSEKHEMARQEAVGLGLPDAAAQYYADERTMMQVGVGVSTPRILRMDDEYEALKDEVRELVGEKGFTMIGRAATADDSVRKHDLGGVAEIFKARQLAGENGTP